MWYVMSLVSMSSQKSFCIDLLFAKVSAFLVGSELACNRGWKFVVLESDCEIARTLFCILMMLFLLFLGFMIILFTILLGGFVPLISILSIIFR
ncbi:LOW QUALITY PROTEIN: hypothetical protein PanWU01x14_327980 [Parasponia andersonii]|uniref:Transmembrane protein n=1 Tax=Parasponia andersonii TaxID=3476 RepID=A0A2P5AIW6_PARAD|nr:LOW QUALITY PROTEIN: hypothetical protein PanWU01x14_327980 [Parasponia andersonii]